MCSCIVVGTQPIIHASVVIRRLGSEILLSDSQTKNMTKPRNERRTLYLWKDLLRGREEVRVDDEFGRHVAVLLLRAQKK